VRRPVGASLLLALALGMSVLVRMPVAGTASARAGEYHVYSCRTPSNQIAPTDGWSGTVAEKSIDRATNECQNGGGLVAALDAGRAHFADTDLATWAFNAPVGETIASATLWRAGDSLGGGSQASYLFWLAANANNGTHQFEECAAVSICMRRGSLTEPLAAENRVVAPSTGLAGSSLYLNASCGSAFKGDECPIGSGDGNGNAAIVELFAADIVLDQESKPTVSNVDGGLAEASTVGGTSDVAFDATDPGSGLYETVFQVDGQTVASPVLDEEGGRCREVGQSRDGLAAFLYTKPCAASLSVDVPFDTTAVSNGMHHFVVSAIDAAGNATPVLDRELVVANATPTPVGAGRGAGNGANASDEATLTARWKASAKATHLRSGYGRAQVLEGRLTGPGGQAIAGARIDLTVIPSSLGARALAIPGLGAGPRTAADGSWSVELPRSVSSCTVRLGYRSHVQDTLAVATRTLTLSVRAGMALRVEPRVSSVGRSIFFRGQLYGGAIPAGGKQLVLEARSAGAPWIEFRVIDTDGRGRFRASYRFRFPGPVRYRFRALSRYEADFPFLAGSSNVVGVSER
jgi:hypothetical protein